jgi:hypothetical protein
VDGLACTDGTRQVRVPPDVRPVNLTPHAAVLDTIVIRHGTTTDDSPELSAVSIARGEGFARVDDEATEVSREWLNAGSRLISLTWLRRSSRITGLPGPQSGRQYVVSRITALAARSRQDLALPFGEVRDAAGGIGATGGLATFRARRLPSIGGWRRTAREPASRKALGSQWFTGAIFAFAMVLLSGSLGLVPGVIGNADKDGWARDGQPWTSWLTVFGAAGLVALALAMWTRRGKILDDRGNAYIVEEQTISWQHEQKASEFTAMRDQSADVLQVAGPGAPGGRGQARAEMAPLYAALGSRLGQRKATWPQRMYALFFAGDRLVVPGLRLGTESVPAERT